MSPQILIISFQRFDFIKNIKNESIIKIPEYINPGNNYIDLECCKNLMLIILYLLLLIINIMI